MNEKLIQIITFTGKRNDWRQWSKKFLAVADRREYRMMLEKDQDALTLNDEDKKKKNTLAYNDLVLAMTDNVSFGLVDEAKSANYPGGDARLAWGKLTQRYESQTSASRVKLVGQFASSRLKKDHQDPDTWISELEVMRDRLKTMSNPIDDEYLMIHIMNNLPSAYDGLIENLEDKLESTFDPLTLGVLRDKLSEKYEKIKRRKGIKDNSSSDEDEEKALFSKTFKGRCRNCGMFGHKAIDCKKDQRKPAGRPNGRQRRFSGKCNFCGKIGHKEVDCWAKHGKPKINDQVNQVMECSEVNEDEVALIVMSHESEYYPQDQSDKTTSTDTSDE